MEIRRAIRYPDSQQLFVGNVPHDVDKAELKEFFERECLVELNATVMLLLIIIIILLIKIVFPMRVSLNELIILFDILVSYVKSIHDGHHTQHTVMSFHWF